MPVHRRASSCIMTRRPRHPVGDANGPSSSFSRHSGRNTVRANYRWWQVPQLQQRTSDRGHRGHRAHYRRIRGVVASTGPPPL